MEPEVLMLALFLVRVCSACINGFPTLETVKDTDASGELPQLITTNIRVGLFPSMNFSCTGNITKWIFQAVASESGTMVPQMQVWRENSATPLTEDYDLQSSSGTEDELRITGDSVYEYVLNSPQPVSEGDVFGVSFPKAFDRELLLQFQDFGLGGAPESYFTDVDAEFFTTEVALVAPNFQYLPMVTVVLAIPRFAHPSESVLPSPSSTTSHQRQTSSLPELMATVTVSVDHTPTSVPETTESTQSSSPVPQPTDESDSSPGSSEQLKVGVFAGVAVGVVIGLILGVVITAVVCLRRRRSKEHTLSSPEAQENQAYEMSDQEYDMIHNSQYDLPHVELSAPTHADLEGDGYSDHGEVDQERGPSTDPQVKSTDENGYAQPDARGINVAGNINGPTQADLEAEGYADPCYHGDADVTKGSMSHDTKWPDLCDKNSTTQHSKSGYINTPTRADLEADGYSDPRYYGD